MTCDQFNHMESTQPMEYQFSLWSRSVNKPQHWELELTNRRDKCWDLAAILLQSRPWREILVLPPLETPLRRFAI
jgi:hypothetical protein